MQRDMLCKVITANSTNTISNTNVLIVVVAREVIIKVRSCRIYLEVIYNNNNNNNIISSSYIIIYIYLISRCIVIVAS